MLHGCSDPVSPVPPLSSPAFNTFWKPDTKPVCAFHNSWPTSSVGSRRRVPNR
jgi:hypothetical protein